MKRNEVLVSVVIQVKEGAEHNLLKLLKERAERIASGNADIRFGGWVHTRRKARGLIATWTEEVSEESLLH